MSQAITLPIAELFVSIQGEGIWTGTPMGFIRIAGCSVGRGQYPFTCTNWNGKTFQCDTDYRLHQMMTLGALVAWMRETDLKHVSITGGEPFLHRKKIETLVDLLDALDIRAHIETSGTIEFNPVKLPGSWVTVSPKEKYLDQSLRDASEIKVLVDAGMNPKDLLRFREYAHKLWLQPINHYDDLDEHNVHFAIEMLTTLSRLGQEGARLSLQMHKVLNVR